MEFDFDAAYLILLASGFVAGVYIAAEQAEQEAAAHRVKTLMLAIENAMLREQVETCRSIMRASRPE